MVEALFTTSWARPGGNQVNFHHPLLLVMKHCNLKCFLYYTQIIKQRHTHTCTHTYYICISYIYIITYLIVYIIIYPSQKTQKTWETRNIWHIWHFPANEIWVNPLPKRLAPRDYRGLIKLRKTAWKTKGWAAHELSPYSMYWRKRKCWKASFFSPK